MIESRFSLRHLPLTLHGLHPCSLARYCDERYRDAVAQRASPEHQRLLAVIGHNQAKIATLKERLELEQASMKDITKRVGWCRAGAVLVLCWCRAGAVLVLC